MICVTGAFAVGFIVTAELLYFPACTKVRDAIWVICSSSLYSSAVDVHPELHASRLAVSLGCSSEQLHRLGHEVDPSGSTLEHRGGVLGWRTEAATNEMCSRFRTACHTLDLLGYGSKTAGIALANGRSLVRY